ncbi:MAG: BON domain-containing protein [Planctomycetes bacterium]|nr:BON domain-containing protein [Planctomycetota bacterium]
MSRRLHAIAVTCLTLALPACDVGSREAPLGEAPPPLSPALAQLKDELGEKGEVTRRRPGPRSGAATAAGGAQVAAKVLSSLAKDPDVPAMSLAVEAEGARVTVRGRVATLEQLEKTLARALEVPEVEEVTVRVTVEPDDGSGATKGLGEGTPPQ